MKFKISYLMIKCQIVEYGVEVVWNRFLSYMLNHAMHLTCLFYPTLYDRVDYHIYNYLNRQMFMKKPILMEYTWNSFKVDLYFFN